MSSSRRDLVLLVSSSGVLGGAERVLVEWAGALERRAVMACPPGALATAAEAAGIGVVPLAARPLARRGRAAAAAMDLARLAGDIARAARRPPPAVVVASGERPMLAAAAAPLGGARLLAVAHDLPRSRAGAAVIRVAAARADAVVATSAAIARSIGRAAEVVHPGVDVAAWGMPDAPAGRPRALVLGALVPWKRADLALEIAARVPEVHLDIAGAPLPGDPPEFTATLRARAALPDLDGRVRFLGAVEDPRTVMAGAHLLLHCADREPFGLVLVEALAAGRPVVAPAAAGPLEIVTPDCGRLYRPSDAEDGARAVAEVLAEPPPPAAARARAAQFDASASQRRFAAIVERLAAC